jgi:Putative peptidoglycan binding domain/LysM domain
VTTAEKDPAMPSHTVAQGECLSSIAERYGFFWETLWNDPGNAPLRARGRNPNTLLPGDVVQVPEKKVTAYERPTGARHTWRVKGVPVKLRMVLTWNEAPRANERYTLDVDGAVMVGATDGDGRIELTIPPGAARGRLRVGDGDRQETYDLALGHLDPVEDLRGVQARLNNLGFACGAPSGTLDDATRAALGAFQARAGLTPTGEADDATRDRLRQAHDGV